MKGSKINIFFSTLNLLLCVAGYQFVTSIFSFVIPDPESSQILTIPYHGFQLAICLITIFINRKNSYNLHNVSKWLFVFWGFLLLRFFYDMYIRSDIFIDSGTKVMHLMYMIPKTLFEMYAVMKSYKYIDFKKLLTFTYLFFIVACICTFFSNEVFQSVTNERASANSALNTIDSGHMGLTTLILSIYLLFYKNTKLWIRICIIVMAFFAIIVFLRSGSRGPIFAFIGCVTIWLLSSSKNQKKSFFVFFVVLIIGYSLFDSLYSMLENIAPNLFNRFEAYSSVGQIDTRIVNYNYAIQTFLDNPVFGKDFAEYFTPTTMIYSHNMVLDAFMQLGLMGGLVFIYILIKTVLRIMEIIKLKLHYSWLGLILIQNIMRCMLSSSFYFTPIISILIILIFLPIPNVNHNKILLKSNLIRHK